MLERASLIRRERDAQWHVCRLGPAPLREAADWIGQYRRFWEGRFDALDDYLKQTGKEAGHGREGRRDRKGKRQRGR